MNDNEDKHNKCQMADIIRDTNYPMIALVNEGDGVRLLISNLSGKDMAILLSEFICMDGNESVANYILDFIKLVNSSKNDSNSSLKGVNLC